MVPLKFGMDEKNVSPVVLGLMRIVDMPVNEVSTLIQTALDHGIDFLDTADCYGKGKSEELLGKVFAQNKGLRENVFVQSKCGIRVDPDFVWFDFSKEHILEAVDGSLRRLGIDYLDCLLLHRPDALMEPDEIAEAFRTLCDAGKVKNFGVSNMNPLMMELLKKYLPFPIAANQVQLSCAFTPAFDAGFNVNMENDAAVMRDGGILEYCRMHDIAIQAWSVMQYGFFEGVFLDSPKYPKLNKVLERIGREKGVGAGVIALAWLLRYPAKMQAVIGTTKADRVIDSAKAADVCLSKKEWYEIYLSAGNMLP